MNSSSSTLSSFSLLSPTSSCPTSSCPTPSYQTLFTLFEDSRRAALINALTVRHRWTRCKAERAIEDYLMFLFVASQPSTLPLVPTVDVDCVWEADILQNTAQYMQTCERFCGRIIHHGSVSELQKVATFNGIEQAFIHTQAILSDRFGTAPSSPNKAAACGLLIDR